MMHANGVGDKATEPVITSDRGCRTGRILVRSSHFMRSMFNSSLGFLDLLSKEPGLAGTNGERYVLRIDSSVRALNSLLEELIDMGRVEAGEEVHLERVDAGALFSVLKERMRPHGIHLEVDCRGPVCLHADDIRLTRTLSRLMTSLAPEGMRDFRISVSGPKKRMVVLLLAGSADTDVSACASRDETEATLDPALNLYLFRGWIEVMGGRVHQATLNPLAFNIKFSLPSSENDETDI